MMKPGGNSCCLPFKDQKKMRANKKRNLALVVAKEISSSIKHQRPSHIDWRAKILQQISASLPTQLFIYFNFFITTLSTWQNWHGQIWSGSLENAWGPLQFCLPFGKPSLWALLQIDRWAGSKESRRRSIWRVGLKNKQQAILFFRFTKNNIKREHFLTSTQRPGFFCGVGALCVY